MKKEVEQIQQLLSNTCKIVFIGHVNPDGDAVCSSISLSLIFKKMGHQCAVLLPDAPDYTLAWISAIKNIVIAKQNLQEAADLIGKADVIFCLDFNNLARIDIMESHVRNNTHAKKILIDHHLNPSVNDFDVVISTPNISSTCELVYEFIKNYGAKELIDVEIATALYVGILTDTGSFSYACHNTNVFRNAADLIDVGIDYQYVRTKLYNMLPESRLRLLGYSLFSKMKVFKQFRAAYIVLSQKELRMLHYQKGDTENLVNYCISIKDIVLGVIIVEQIDKIKLSFRSRGDFDVSKLAKAHFEGGGHKNASGGNNYGSLDETILKLETILEQNKQELRAVKI